jgi:hypothetical protein
LPVIVTVASSPVMTAARMQTRSFSTTSRVKQNVPQRTVLVSDIGYAGLTKPMTHTVVDRVIEHGGWGRIANDELGRAHVHVVVSAIGREARVESAGARGASAERRNRGRLRGREGIWKLNTRRHILFEWVSTVVETLTSKKLPSYGIPRTVTYGAVGRYSGRRGEHQPGQRALRRVSREGNARSRRARREGAPEGQNGRGSSHDLHRVRTMPGCGSSSSYAENGMSCLQVHEVALPRRSSCVLNGGARRSNPRLYVPNWATRMTTWACSAPL